MLLPPHPQPDNTAKITTSVSFLFGFLLFAWQVDTLPMLANWLVEGGANFKDSSKPRTFFNYYCSMIYDYDL
jgi:hypothetical protein